MTLPTAGSAFGYDLLSYNYHVAAAAAAATHSNLNGSTHSLSSQKSDRSSSGRDSRGERERRDSTSRDGRSMYANQVNHDKPPFSRVFVVCGKSHSSDDIKKSFEKYGNVEDVWVVKDKHTKENRGVAYVKFSKMSEACLAVESMDGQKINDNDAKPLKVIIAQPKSSKSTEDFHDESALTRLFVVIPKGVDEAEVRKSFESYGDVEYVQIVKDRRTGEKKGFGYVKYNRAYEAAVAVENSDKCYKAVMAEPKPSKNKKELLEGSSFANTGVAAPGISNGIELAMSLQNPARNPSDLSSQLGFNIGTPDNNRNGRSIGNRLQVQVSPTITQEQLARLFDLIPGMELCDVKKNYSTGESKGIAVIVYNTVGAAIYAKEKLNGFEYPPGCKLHVRYAPDEEEAVILQPPVVQPIEIPQQNQLLYCSVPLPSPKPMSDSDNCVERLFIVCHPNPPPEQVLKDIFSRFGDLIDLYLLKNKNFGYAKFSRAEPAENAIQVLHGAEVMGKRLKVLHAEPPKGNETSRKRPRN